MLVRKAASLTERERTLLVAAIEGAIAVNDRQQFHDWIRGPFHALLPHVSVVGVALDGAGRIGRLESVARIEPESPERRESDQQLALRLVHAFSASPHLPVCVDGASVHRLLGLTAGEGEPWPAFSAVIHRTRFLNGSGYYIVVLGVAQAHGASGLYLLELLSSHLKMALARIIRLPEPVSAPPITRREAEILGWMGQGKSNQEISAILGISPLTLKNHVRKIYRKLDVNNREEAVARGGMLDGEPGQCPE